MLRRTWNEVFLPEQLYAIDVRVNAIDPGWPITAVPPAINVNPTFFHVSTNTVFTVAV
jgi:pre-mRNA cleavage complex 2 protein Pcf11